MQTKDIKTVKHKKKLRGLPAALLCAVIFCLVISVSVILSSRTSHFEGSSAHEFVNSYLSGSRDALIACAQSYVDQNITEFENEKAVKEDLGKLISEGEITFYRSEEYSDKKPVYTVFADGNELFTLTLRGKRSLLRNFSGWGVSNITVSPQNDIATEYFIEAPTDADITLNGKKLEGGYAIADNIPYHKLSVFEAGLSDKMICKKYKIGYLFSDPKLEASAGGQALTVSDIKDGTVYLSYSQKRTKTYKLTVPQGALLTVNGVLANEAFIFDKNVPYPFISRLETEREDVPRCSLYVISGLFNEPEFKVMYNGKELSHIGEGKYALPEETTKSYKIYAPQDALVKVNGVGLSKGEISAEKTEYPLLDGVGSYAKKRPYLVEYTVSGLFAQPRVSVTDSNGQSLVSDLKYSGSDVFYYQLAPSGEMPEDDTKAVIKFAKIYAQYIHGGVKNRNIYFDDITLYTPAKTLSLQKVRDIYSSLKGQSASEELKLGEGRAEQYRALSSNAFSCRVTLGVEYTKDGETVNETVSLDILYIRSGKSVRVVNFIE